MAGHKGEWGAVPSGLRRPESASTAARYRGQGLLPAVRHRHLAHHRPSEQTSGELRPRATLVVCCDAVTSCASKFSPICFIPSRAGIPLTEPGGLNFTCQGKRTSPHALNRGEPLPGPCWPEGSPGHPPSQAPRRAAPAGGTPGCNQTRFTKTTAVPPYWNSTSQTAYTVHFSNIHKHNIRWRICILNFMIKIIHTTSVLFIPVLNLIPAIKISFSIVPHFPYYWIACTSY